MNHTAKRFATGFAVTAMVAGLANLLPYFLTRGAYNGDGFEVIGFPLTFRRLGGIAGIYEFGDLALLADLVLALLVATAAGYSFAKLSHRPGT